MTVSFFGGGNRSIRRKPATYRRVPALIEIPDIVIVSFIGAASHGQTLSHNAVSSTPRMSGIRTLNFSGDRY